MIRHEFWELLEALQRGVNIPTEGGSFLLSTTEAEERQILFQVADRVRKESVGDEVHLRAIVEFSNFCVQNCLYCGLRRDNRRLLRYRMPPREIIQTVKKVKEKGYPTVVLQSGEDPWFTRGQMTDLIRGVKEETGLVITLSVGEREFGDYEAWKRAGADRYLLKQETSSPDLYERLRPGRRLEERLNSLKVLRELDYEVGSGNMVGLPGQKIEDLTRDIEIFAQNDFDMIGIGPFIPHPHTPLAREAPGSLILTLKVLALTRILTRDTNLPATTALGVPFPKGREEALRAGANVVMPDLTPWKYRKNYQIYPGKARRDREEEKIAKSISSLGRKISPGPGYRISAKRT